MRKPMEPNVIAIPLSAIDERSRVVQTVVAALAATALLWVTPAYGDVGAEPNDITFYSMDETHRVSLLSNGEPVPAAQISAAKLYVGNHDYDYMIRVAKEEGGVSVTPTDMAEIGTYQLVVNTEMGKAYVSVNMPLSDIAKGADALPPEELKPRSLQLAGATPGTAVDVQTEGPYYVGQTFRMTMETADDAVYTWLVNGLPVAEGTGPSSLAYTFKEAGQYDIAYVERENDQGVVKASLVVVVQQEKPILVEPAIGTRYEFKGPDGYEKYAWVLDGEVVSRSQDFTHTFEQAGEHILVCVVETDRAGAADAYREISYRVTVRR